MGVLGGCTIFVFPLHSMSIPPVNSLSAVFAIWMPTDNPLLVDITASLLYLPFGPQPTIPSPPPMHQHNSLCAVFTIWAPSGKPPLLPFATEPEQRIYVCVDKKGKDTGKGVWHYFFCIKCQPPPLFIHMHIRSKLLFPSILCGIHLYVDYFVQLYLLIQCA